MQSIFFLDDEGDDFLSQNNYLKPNLEKLSYRDSSKNSKEKDSQNKISNDIHDEDDYCLIEELDTKKIIMDNTKKG